MDHLGYQLAEQEDGDEPGRIRAEIIIMCLGNEFMVGNSVYTCVFR